MKVGSIVLCIEGGPSGKRVPHDFEKFPIKSQEYTIRALNNKGDACILEEIINPVVNYRDGRQELHFYTKRFVELQSPEEGTQIIEEINTQPVELCNNI